MPARTTRLVTKSTTRSKPDIMDGSSPPPEKERSRNAKAQKAHRERRAAHIKRLETRNAELEALASGGTSTLLEENERLRQQRDSLQSEVDELKRSLDDAKRANVEAFLETASRSSLFDAAPKSPTPGPSERGKARSASTSYASSTSTGLPSSGAGPLRRTGSQTGTVEPTTSSSPTFSALSFGRTADDDWLASLGSVGDDVLSAGPSEQSSSTATMPTGVETSFPTHSAGAPLAATPHQQIQLHYHVTLPYLPAGCFPPHFAGMTSAAPPSDGARPDGTWRP